MPFPQTRPPAPKPMPIAEAGAGQAAQLSSGISQALITTATGLLIAIPALVAHNFFSEKAEAIIADLEQESLRVLRGLYYSAPPEPATTQVIQTAGLPAE